VNGPYSDLLETIFEHKRAEVAMRKKAIPLTELEEEARRGPAALDFAGALRNAPHRPALIAEIKRASPSRGPLAADLDPVALARTYRAGGAAAISVLTDERFFRGSLDDLRAVAALQPRAPLLRKDFILDPYQVFEARAAGADAVLLIAAYLDSKLLCELHGIAEGLGMAALVEVHDEEDLERALACGPSLIGINNRDLHTFEVSLDVTRRIAPLIPPHIAVVAESGIFTPEHVRALGRGEVFRPDSLASTNSIRGTPRPYTTHARGVDAILVGEALVTAPDTAALVRALALAGRPNPDHRPAATEPPPASAAP
jgi:indole-3-glycerol phosphate synthase